MTKLLTKNAKITKANNENYTVYNFGIPAYRSTNGTTTCPSAGKCKIGCYAQAGTYTWGNVSQAYEYRLQTIIDGSFERLIMKELNVKATTAKRQGKQLVIRIHDSGDFFSLDYIKRWLEIMRTFSEVKFYAYTKQIKLFKAMASDIPNNFTLIFSEGGLFDGDIHPAVDRHARVFSSQEELESAGYVNAMENDLVAPFDANHKIGLIYHGSKAKTWKTGA